MLSFRDISEGPSAVAVHSGCCRVEPSVNQAGVFSSLCQLTVRTVLWGLRCKLGERSSRVGVGTWAFGPLVHVTYLYLQGLLGLDHVHTTSVGWWSAAVRLVSWLGGQITNTLFLMGSSSQMVTWWLMMKCSISFKAQ